MTRRTIPAVSDTVEVLRIAQVAILVVTLSVLGARVNAWWCSSWRCLLPAAGTGTIATFIVIAQADALLHNRPGGVGTGALLLACVALLMQACTVGIGRSHARGTVHPPSGPYIAFDPATGSPCAPGGGDC